MPGKIISKFQRRVNETLATLIFPKCDKKSEREFEEDSAFIAMF